MCFGKSEKSTCDSFFELDKGVEMDYNEWDFEKAEVSALEWLENSYLMQFLLICAMVAFACTKVTLQGVVSRRHIRGAADSVLFNALLFAVMSLILGVLFPMELFSWKGWIIALGGALCSFVFQATYSIALQCGPVSLSVMIVNFNVLLITVFSIVAFRESVYLSQLIGILFLAVSIVLSVKKEESGKRANKKWLVLLVVALISTAGGTVFMKIFTRWFSESEKQDNAFVTCMYAIAAVLALVWYCIGALGKHKQRSTFGFTNLRVWGFVIVIGVVLGIFQKLYMMGMAHIDGGFMFPTYAGLQSMCMTCMGIFLFRDKLSARQWIGIACGIVCVVLMNIRFMPLF